MTCLPLEMRVACEIKCTFCLLEMMKVQPIKLSADLFSTKIAMDRRKNWNTLEMKWNLIFGHCKSNQFIMPTKMSDFVSLPVSVLLSHC